MSVKSSSGKNLLDQYYFEGSEHNKSGEGHFSGQEDIIPKNRQTVLEELPRRQIYISRKHYQPLQGQYERVSLSSDDRPLCSDEASHSPEVKAYLSFLQEVIKITDNYIKELYFHEAEKFFESEKQIFLEKNENIKLKIEAIFSEQLQKAKEKIKEESSSNLEIIIAQQACVASNLAKSEIKKSAFLEAQKSAFLDAKKYLKDGKIDIKTAAEKANLTSKEYKELLEKYVIEEGLAEEAMKNGRTGTTGRKVAEQFGITNQEDIKILKKLANNQIKNLGFFKGCALNFKNKFI